MKNKADRILNAAIVVLAIAVAGAVIIRHAGRVAAEPPFVAVGMDFDAGQVKKGSPVKHSVRFVNHGSSALVLESAVVGCTCTTVDTDHATIAPRASKSVGITVDTSDMDTGPQFRTVDFELKSGSHSWLKTATIQMTIH